jgi:hypothetical protein
VKLAVKRKHIEVPQYKRGPATRWLVTHGFETWALRREMRLQTRFYRRALKVAGWKDRDLRQEISHRWEMDDCETLDDLRLALTEKLRAQASRLDVALPYDTADGPDKYWRRSEITAEVMFSDLGVEELRTRIRQERQARREVVAFW